MRDLMRNLKLGAITAGLIVLATSALAVPITTPGLTIVSGDKTFFNFTCNVSAGSLGGLFTCDEINVDPHVSTNPPDPTTGDQGIRITGSLVTLVGTSVDVQIEYDAIVSTGSFLFHDASMWYNGTVVTSVLENVFDNDPSSPTFGIQIGSLFVSNPGTPSADIVLDTNTRAIHVIKDIGLNCVANAGCTALALISIIDQQFSQVPEPGSLALLGLGLASLAGWSRKRAK